MRKKILIIGGGAAGYFGAIQAAKNNPKASITIVESSSKPLQKVAISGGGRCNVTQGCFDTDELLKGYPRGSKELKSAFHTFQSNDTVKWFKKQGVILKREEDGRMFPVTDSSKTIIDCFEKQRKTLGIELLLKTKVSSVKKIGEKLYRVNLSSKQSINKESKSENFNTILIATGNSSSGYAIAKSLSHTIKKCVPSLFTFKVNDTRLKTIPGVSVQNASLKLKVAASKFSCRGPILITHWGFSGPATIKLSAFAAKELYENSYNAVLQINWLPESNTELYTEQLDIFRVEHPKKSVIKNPFMNLPKRLWEQLCIAANINKETPYCELKKKSAKLLQQEIFLGTFKVEGKGIFKEEFVTCGGLSLKEIDFRTMQSKLNKGIFFAGEVLDIDGITGGYNFQNAWTTSFIAGSSM